MLNPIQNGRDFQSAIRTMITEVATYHKKSITITTGEKHEYSNKHRS